MRVLKHLYFQTLTGLAAGVLAGYFAPRLGVPFKPLGDTSVRPVAMLVTLPIFRMASIDIARRESLKPFGRAGLKSILYFWIVPTIALLGFDAKTVRAMLADSRSALKEQTCPPIEFAWNLQK